MGKTEGSPLRTNMTKQKASCRRCGGYVLPDADSELRCLQCGRPYTPSANVRPRDVGKTACVACREPFYQATGHLCAQWVVVA